MVQKAWPQRLELACRLEFEHLCSRDDIAVELWISVEKDL